MIKQCYTCSHYVPNGCRPYCMATAEEPRGIRLVDHHDSCPLWTCGGKPAYETPEWSEAFDEMRKEIHCS